MPSYRIIAAVIMTPLLATVLRLSSTADLERLSQKAPATTLELRWFFEGSVPADVDEWFSQDPRLGESLSQRDGRERTDLYLVPEGTDAVGVKLRDGRLEIKLRVAAENFVGVDGDLTGRAEMWKKWEWDYSDSLKEQVFLAFADQELGGLRRQVYKNRRRRKFAVSNDGEVVPKPDTTHVQVGCLLELTKVIAGEKESWSLAFDAFGGSDGSRGTLRRCVVFVFKDYPGSMPEATASYSYPSFLRRL